MFCLRGRYLVLLSVRCYSYALPVPLIARCRLLAIPTADVFFPSRLLSRPPLCLLVLPVTARSSRLPSRLLFCLFGSSCLLLLSFLLIKVCLLALPARVLAFHHSTTALLPLRPPCYCYFSVVVVAMFSYSPPMPWLCTRSCGAAFSPFFLLLFCSRG